MTETIVEKQVRLVLERQCSDLFRFLRRALFAGFPACDLSLLVFDYAPGHTAFATTLPEPLFVATLEGALRRWHTGVGEVDPSVPLVDGAVLEALSTRARTLLPAGVGHGIFVGRGRTSVYIGSGERSGVAELIGELLESMRADTGGAS